MNLKNACGALIALCSVAAVQAQTAGSSVTMYGRVDVGVMRQWGLGPSKTSEDNYHTSRLGFRGVEDLGGGLSAMFKLETRFIAKNGGQQDAATYWNDETYVGLQSKSAGTLKLGRVYSPFYLAVAGRIDPFNGDGIGSMTGLTSLGHNLSPGNPYDAAKGFVTRDVRTNNSIDYTSPTFAGFSSQVQKSFSEAAGRPGGISVVAKYDSPTLFAQTGYERKAFSLHAYTTHIGGGYVMGPAKFSVGYTRGYYSDDEYARGNKGASAIVGLTYNMDNLVLLAAASRIRMDKPTLLDAAAGTGSNLTKIAVGADYYLSKRTKLYGHLAHFSDPMSILFVGNSKRAMVGIDHAF
jgi:general bacterial porin, GBP family